MDTASWISVLIPCVVSLVGIVVSTIIVLKVATAVHERSIAYLEKELSIVRQHQDTLRDEVRQDLLKIHQTVIERLLDTISEIRRNE